MPAKILVYGTVARQGFAASQAGARRWKTSLRAALDRILCAAGSYARLDYRNYDLPYATNRGDIAIAKAVRNHFRLALTEVTFSNVNWGELERLDAAEISAEYALVVIAGSGYFHYSAEGVLAQRVANDLAFWEKISTPIVLYGVGVNRLLPLHAASPAAKLNAADESILRRVLRRMSLLGVRSADAREALSPYASKPVQLVCDPALFLEPQRRHQYRREIYGSAAVPKIGVNFAFHGPLSSKILQRNFTQYLHILRTLHAQTGCSFHYFIHNHSEWIIPQLLRDKGLKVEAVAGDPYALLHRYAEMNVHLGGMLHSGILATGAGTPCVLLAYDAKHFGFARLLGMEAHCHKATPLDSAAVLHSLSTLLANEAEARLQLGERLARLWQEQEKFLHDCSALLPASHAKHEDTPTTG